MPTCFFVVGLDDKLYLQIEDVISEIKKHLKPDNFNNKFEVKVHPNCFTVYIETKEMETF